ncbi:MAG TPA: site-2 protease family protein [Gaiellaceae bacterium]|nr:site-2 protease family protein [Gaiellaceae bacterium]
MNVAVAIGGLAFLILIHEAGHFLVALAVKMRPRKFYIFFPPALAKWRRNGIEYGIGSIPLGGYVKIPGMHRPAAGDLDAYLEPARRESPSVGDAAEPVERALAEKQLDGARALLPDLRAAVSAAELSPPARKAAERGLTEIEDGLSPEAYWRASAGKRIAVIAAGPGVNLLFAIVALAVVFMLGVPTGVSRSVEEVSAGSPAAAMGLQPGDRIVAVNDVRGEPEDLAETIREGEGEPVAVTVERGGETLTLEGTPRLDPVDDVYRLGFAFGLEEESYGPLEATKLAFETTWLVTKEIGASLGRIVTGSGRDEVASVVGITAVSSEALEAGARYYLQVLAFISLSLALLNLLPLLPLDGGHIAFSIAERIRGRAIPRIAYERFSAIGIAVVLLLFMIGLSNDIGRLRDGG